MSSTDYLTAAIVGTPVVSSTNCLTAAVVGHL